MHEIPFVYNFPFFSIILTLVGAMATPFIRNGRAAQKVNMGVIIGAGLLNGAVLINLVQTGHNFTYIMGHFPAPFGNEIRGGPLEALMATMFCLVMGLSISGGLKNIYEEIPKKKQNLYFLMMNLILCSLISMTYTNDMFNAYVFIEINTIAACAIVMAKDSRETTVATIRYLIMSQIGSGLFLLALALFYNITGHLLMVSLHQAVGNILVTGQYVFPAVVVASILTVALAIKSASYPFHTWLPGAHGSATSSSSAILSGIVLKGYIILLIKIIYRVFSPEFFAYYHISDAILVLGILSMILGSVNALRERHIKRMTAFSTVAQIGYILMGIGLNSEIGMMAACFHIIAHAITKPMLFLAAGGLANVSHHSYEFKDLRGAAHRNKLAGIAFVIGGLSMIGIPLFIGFPSKLYFSTAAIYSDWFRLVAVLVALAISTVLNALYYIPVMFNIWKTKDEPAHGHDAHASEESHTESNLHLDTHGSELAETHGEGDELTHKHGEEKDRITFGFAFSMVAFIILNIGLGIFYKPFMDIIKLGLDLL